MERGKRSGGKRRKRRRRGSKNARERGSIIERRSERRGRKGGKKRREEKGVEKRKEKVKEVGKERGGKEYSHSFFILFYLSSYFLVFSILFLFSYLIFTSSILSYLLPRLPSYLVFSTIFVSCPISNYYLCKDNSVGQLLALDPASPFLPNASHFLQIYPLPSHRSSSQVPRKPDSSFLPATTPIFKGNESTFYGPLHSTAISTC
jgi:hypothetical protein